MQIDELLTLKQELLEVIANIEEIKNYQIIREQMLENKKIMRLIRRQKNVQKQLVNAKAVHIEGQAALLEAEMLAIDEELLAIPLYQQHEYARIDAQETLDTIFELLQERLMVETE